MIHIHPFPARMAPDIALDRIESLPREALVLDPMCGSGMVLSQAARSGVRALGFDLDPLARLISRVGSTRVRESAVHRNLEQMLDFCESCDDAGVELDEETRHFVEYWFGPTQARQLHRMARYFERHNGKFGSPPRNVLAVALSRLIISKEPKASLARDTAHSRPHKTIDENEFDIVSQVGKSVKHVLKALQPDAIKTNSRTYHGDARNLSRVRESSIDVILTSPPYLNAIDYMRGHKFSLIWFGYRLSVLRAIRSSAIGSEAAGNIESKQVFVDLLSSLGLSSVEGRTRTMLLRYYVDLRRQLGESRRVLKRDGRAFFVIGNSSIRGNYIENNEILKFAARDSGFRVEAESIRKIPNNRRYLPVNVGKANALSSRMRTEHIVELVSQG